MKLPIEYAEELRRTQGWALVEKEINEAIRGLEYSLLNKSPDSLIEVREKQAKLRTYNHVLLLVNGK